MRCFRSGNAGITGAGALALALGIAIQNFPEGAIVSMPLRAEGMSKGKTFLYGVLSGVVEPIAAAVTIVAAGTVVPVMPYLLAFAAGAMMYVVVEELIPEMSEGKHSNWGNHRLHPGLCADDDSGRDTGMMKENVLLTGGTGFLGRGAGAVHRAGTLLQRRARKTGPAAGGQPVYAAGL